MFCKYFGLCKTGLLKSKTIEEHVEAQTKLSTNCREHKDLTKTVTYFLCKDTLLAYTVKKSVFVKTLTKFNLHYDLAWS